MNNEKNWELGEIFKEKFEESKQNGENLIIGIIGKEGCGKTTLAFTFAEYLDETFKGNEVKRLINVDEDIDDENDIIREVDDNSVFIIDGITNVNQINCLENKQNKCFILVFDKVSENLQDEVKKLNYIICTGNIWDEDNKFLIHEVNNS